MSSGKNLGTQPPPPPPKGSVKIDETEGTITWRSPQIPSLVGLALGTSVVRIAGATIELLQDNVSGPKSTIFKVNAEGNLSIGGDGVHGLVAVRDKEDHETVKIDGKSGQIGIGSTIKIDGKTGQIDIGSTIKFDGPAKQIDVGAIKLKGKTGNLDVGGNGVHGQISMFDKYNKPKLLIDGNTGDIILQNADCAEDFDVADLELAEPGTVMVLNADGSLRPCNLPYDRKAVGVISGAGEYRPGIVLDRKPSAGPRAPIAMFGKVFCKVDAAHGCIEVGDLLTTSPTAGHAMKAADPTRAFGALIGKALRAHTSGCGLIPILVVMQ
jgi:hypothetical protein